MTGEKWPVAPAGALFEIQLGKMIEPSARGGPRPLPYLANRHVQWHHADVSGLPRMSFSAGERERYRLRAGDVLVCEGGEVGRTALWRGELPECYYQKAIHRLRPRDDGAIEPAFMVWYMRACAARGRLADQAARTSIAHLTVPRLSRLLVPVPPIAEQRRIAAALDAAREAARTAEAVVAKLARLELALVEELVARGGADDVRGPDVRGADGRAADGPVVRLGEILAGPPVAGYSPPPSARPTGTYALGLACLTPLGFRPEALKHVSADDPRVAGALLADGDLLVSRANTRALVGLAGIYRDVGAPCIYPDLMLRLVPGGRVLPRFLELALRTAACRAQLEARARGTSDSMVKLTSRSLSEVRIRLPDLAAQARAVAAPLACAERREREDARRRKLEQLEAALLADLFHPAP